MKTQITTLAAAVAFAMSTAAFAQYSGGSDSTIYQSGNNNTNDVTQWGSQNSRIYQQGSYNSATVSQDDVSGVATTLPGLNDSGIEQFGSGNSADVTQLGTKNDSTVYQETLFNSATVDQEGYKNVSVVEKLVSTMTQTLPKVVNLMIATPTLKDFPMMRLSTKMALGISL